MYKKSVVLNVFMKDLELNCLLGQKITKGHDLQVGTPCSSYVEVHIMMYCENRKTQPCCEVSLQNFKTTWKIMKGHDLESKENCCQGKLLCIMWPGQLMTWSLQEIFQLVAVWIWIHPLVFYYNSGILKYVITKILKCLFVTSYPYNSVHRIYKTRNVDWLNEVPFAIHDHEYISPLVFLLCS